MKARCDHAAQMCYAQADAALRRQADAALRRARARLSPTRELTAREPRSRCHRRNPGPAVAHPEGNMAATEPEDSDPALNPDLARGSTARLSQMGDDKIAQLCAKYDKDGNGKFAPRHGHLQRPVLRILVARLGLVCRRRRFGRERRRKEEREEERVRH